ncbi:hypothetical protein GGI12_006218, partial [Dipsacomyces acuminosporus]
TPWLFNTNSKIFISYDDPQSIKVKVDYAASKGLAGAMIWSVNMDYNNELMNVIQQWPGGGNPSTSSIPGSSTTAAPTSSTRVTSSAPGTTSTTAVTTTTSGAPPTSSTTTGGGSGPVAGGPCSTDGANQCADSTGKNPNYFLCLYGKWVAQACGSGTACFQSGNSVSCGWPSS